MLEMLHCRAMIVIEMGGGHRELLERICLGTLMIMMTTLQLRCHLAVAYFLLKPKLLLQNEVEYTCTRQGLQ